jgi:putative iron-dependent peroxidase
MPSTVVGTLVCAFAASALAVTTARLWEQEAEFEQLKYDQRVKEEERRRKEKEQARTGTASSATTTQTLRLVVDSPSAASASPAIVAPVALQSAFPPVPTAVIASPPAVVAVAASPVVDASSPPAYPPNIEPAAAAAVAPVCSVTSSPPPTSQPTVSASPVIIISAPAAVDSPATSPVAFSATAVSPTASSPVADVVASPSADAAFSAAATASIASAVPVPVPSVDVAAAAVSSPTLSVPVALSDDLSSHDALPLSVLSHTTGFSEPALTNPAVALTKKAQIGVISRADTWLSLQMQVLCDLSVDGSLATLHFILSQIPEWTTEVSLQHPDARLSSIIGIDAELWGAMDPAPPSELRAFNSKFDRPGTQCLLAASPQTFVLFLKCNRMDLMYDLSQKILHALGIMLLRQEVYTGFKYGKEGRDLTGFVDGTRNFDGALSMLQAVALIDGKTFSEGASVLGPPSDAEHLGGSYAYFGRFVHDLGVFGGMSGRERSECVGRDYSIVTETKREEGSEVVSSMVKYENPLLPIEPVHSHLHLCYLPMLRQGFPYQSPFESGLLFLGLSKSLEKLDEVLERMTKGFSAGVKDKIFGFTKAVSGGYLYVPSLLELKRLNSSSYYRVHLWNRELQYRHTHHSSVHTATPTPSRKHSMSSSSSSYPDASPRSSRSSSFSTAPPIVPSSPAPTLSAAPSTRFGARLGKDASSSSVQSSPQATPPTTPKWKPQPSPSPVSPSPHLGGVTNAFKPFPSPRGVTTQQQGKGKK